MHLTWEESGTIYYSQVDFDGLEYYYVVDKESVSDGAGYSNHKYPSITIDGSRRPNILWQAYSGVATEMEIILHARRSGSYPNEWSYASFHGNDDYHEPSITGFPGLGSGNNELRGVWYRSTDMLWVAQYDGSTWSDFYQWLNGYEPNISSNKGAAGDAKMVYRQYTSPPFLLKTTSQNLNSTESLSKKSTPLSQSFDRHRRGVLEIGNSEVAYEFGELQVNGNPVDLFSYPDTLLAGVDGQWEEMFRTNSFIVSNRADVTYANSFEVLNRPGLQNVLSSSAGVQFQLELIDARTGELLATPDKISLAEEIPADFNQLRNMVFQTGEEKEVYLRVNLSLPPGLESHQSIVRVFYLGSPKRMEKQTEQTPVVVNLTPREFQLAQNYPNPFNPTTTIAFNLPAESNILLEIFDLTGKKIRTLTNAYYQAGRHQVLWNGTDDRGRQVASGLYVYRIQAEDFVQSRKMLMMK